MTDIADQILSAAKNDVEHGHVPEIEPVLQFMSLTELQAKVAAAGPRRWLLRGIWPAGDYGIHAAEMKAQKTWNTVDLAVSVASGTAWLGAVDVCDPGAVLMFAGEGSEANLVRRIAAVATSRGLAIGDLPIVVCARAPHLIDTLHLAAIGEQLEQVTPRLVTLDPLYLAARGAQGSSLYDMGAMLERPQHMCQDAGAALFVVTHHNRKDGRGAVRISGAGPAEWGRVLVNATVVSRHTDPTSQQTTQVAEVDVIGGEVADSTWRLTRRIRAADPDDLDSPLIYHVETHVSQQRDDDDMPPARRKLLGALRDADGMSRTVAQLVDAIAAEHGHGLKRETCSRELNALAKSGLVDKIEAAHGRPAEWFIAGAKQGV